jgi:2-iminoacetate synthase ThiH
MEPTVYTASTASDLEYGIVNETSIILTSFSRNVTAVKTEVRDADNDVVAVAYSGKTAAITLEGFINGNSTYNVAALLTLTNDTTTSGLTDGTIIVDSVNESSAQGEFKKISVSATQYANTLI